MIDWAETENNVKKSEQLALGDRNLGFGGDRFLVWSRELLKIFKFNQGQLIFGKNLSI
jgi:hypothetical protein